MKATPLLLLAALPFLLGAAPLADAVDSVVRIEAGSGTGTGFAAEPGLIVTAAHVVEGHDTVQVLHAGDVVTADVVLQDAGRDLAAIAVPPEWGPRPMDIRTAEPAVGDAVFAAGHVLGEDDASISRGIVSAQLSEDGVRVLRTDAAINEGMSGGPLVDAQGKVVGVIVAKIAPAEGVGIVTAAGELRPFLEGTHTDSSHNTSAPVKPVVGGSVVPAAAAGLGAVVLLTLYALRRKRRPSCEPPIDDIAIVLGTQRLIHHSKEVSS